MSVSDLVGAEDYRRPNRDPSQWHPLVRLRWPPLLDRLERDGFQMFVNEGYRPELRQQWLWAQGRSAPECSNKGIPPAFARPGLIVTNASSARLSAHGVTEKNDLDETMPAAAALDVVPVGTDGKPWTADDPWDAWLATLAVYGAEVGLIHFTSRGKITDTPHLQLVEWCDRCHLLHLDRRCPLSPGGSP
jgi:hypothetical protein